MTTVNVNLRTCDCGMAHPDLYPPNDPQWGDKHRFGCAQTPIDIPLPVKRSVTMTVRLGECECVRPALQKPGVDGHRKQCPARPIRVSCSIGGDGTWAGSEVTDAWPADGDGSGNLDGLDWPEELAACRSRWEIVKALVTGGGTNGAIWQQHTALVQQRDAVFAALATLARTEMAYYDAHNVALAAVDGTTLMVPEPHNRPSARVLERYVEQVGNLP